MNTWKIGYINRSKALIWVEIVADTCMEALQVAMSNDPDYMNCCYSECLSYKKPL